MKNTKKGFAPVILILIAVVVIGSGAYFLTQNKNVETDFVTENTVANSTSTTTSDTTEKTVVQTETKTNSITPKPKVTATASGDYSIHKSPAGFQLKYPKDWEVVEMTLAKEQPQYKGSVNIFPTDGLIDKTLATNPYGAIIKNINTQSFTVLVQSSKPGQQILQEELTQELYKESKDIIDEEITFSQPGQNPSMSIKEKTATSIVYTYEYSYNGILFKGIQRSVIFHNTKENIYSAVMMHYRAKATVFDQKTADTLLNSITFN